MSKNQVQPEQQQPVTAWLVTAKQAAQILSVSERTVWAMIARGDFPTVQFGTARRIWLSDLQEFAKRHTVAIPTA